MVRKNEEDIVAALRNVIENSYFKDMTTALRSNGKSKSVEDFNVLDEYQSRFNESPSILKITHDDCDLFLYEKLKMALKEEFKNSKFSNLMKIGFIMDFTEKQINGLNNNNEYWIPLSKYRENRINEIFKDDEQV